MESIKKRHNKYERGPTLQLEDFLDPENPVREFQIYEHLSALKRIVYKGYVDHFEDEAGVPVEDPSQVYYIVANTSPQWTTEDPRPLGRYLDAHFVASWDTEQNWLEVHSLFNHVRYTVCRPLEQPDALEEIAS